MLEMKVRLLRQLSAASRVKSPSALQGPPQAHQFISLLLEEYGALCQAARTISTFLGTLVSRLCPLPGTGGRSGGSGGPSRPSPPPRCAGGAGGLIPLLFLSPLDLAAG